MISFQDALGYIISCPARIKGMKFGRGSFIGPGYDFLDVRLRGITLGDTVLIGRNAWLQTNPNFPESKITIGNGTHIGRNSSISAAKEIKIGSGCLFSFNVSILDHDHFFGYNVSPVNDKLSKPKSITINDNCFVGAHSFILKGVELGHHCVVGANSVVTKSFPPYSIIAGNPAKLLKSLQIPNKITR